MKPSSNLVVFVLVAACAMASPSERSLVSSNQPPSVESSDPSQNVATEPLTPASRTHAPTQGASAVGLLPSDTDPRGSVTEPTETRDATPSRTPDVVYVPTPQVIVDKMLALAKVKQGDVLYDLGCGDGRIVVTGAKKYGVKAVGFDIDPKRVAEARANVQKNHVQDLVTIEHKVIFTIDLSQASVVTLYLLPSLNDRLLPQLEKLAPGSRVVSHDYGLTDVVPVEHLTMKPTGEAHEHEIYFWKTPFKRKPALSQLGTPGTRIAP